MRLSLIGPVSVGKSTIARQLADAMSIEHHMFDQECWAYFSEVGYSAGIGNDLLRRGRYQEYLDYQQEYVDHGLRRFVESHPEGVLDFGGMHTSLACRDSIGTLRAYLEGEPVVLLLPSLEPDDSLRILRNRSAARGHLIPDEKVRERMGKLREKLLDSAIRGSVLRELATKTVVTGPLTTRETFEQVLGLVAPGN